MTRLLLYGNSIEFSIMESSPKVSVIEASDVSIKKSSEVIFGSLIFFESFGENQFYGFSETEAYAGIERFTMRL